MGAKISSIHFARFHAGTGKLDCRKINHGRGTSIMDQRRRFSDKIIEAHGQACDEGKIEVAEALLRALEVDMSAIGGKLGADKRESTGPLEAAYLRHEQAKGAKG
ncbi:MAG: hypothetical protein ACI82H_000276 [Alphaproteobacteria bacterium]